MSEIMDVFQRYSFHSNKWKELERKFDFEKVKHQVDVEKLKFEDLEKYTELELIALMYATEPPWASVISLIGYTCGYYKIIVKQLVNFCQANILRNIKRTYIFLDF